MMNLNAIEIIFGAVLTAITGVCIATIRSNWKIFKSLQSSQKALIKDRVVQAHEHFCGKGAIGKYSLNAIEEMYKEYKNLGGNGFIKRLMDDLHELNIK